MSIERLPQDFYSRSALDVAPALLGKLLVHVTDDGITSGYITETEAYMGPEDRAAHSFAGRRTVRTETMFGPAGHAYVYQIYGIHFCFNVVVAQEGEPQAVLVRALNPKDGQHIMQMRRQKSLRKSPANPIDKKRLTDGPGKLCQALDITKDQNGQSLASNSLFLTSGIQISPTDIVVGPRINIAYAGEWASLPWRFVWNHQG